MDTGLHADDENQTVDKIQTARYLRGMDTAVVSFDPDAIIDRIASGTLTRTIAAELGMSKSALKWRIDKHPRYEEAIQNQAEALVEKATEELMSEALPPHNAFVSRARARVDAAHKWAAARDPARWAPGQRLMGGDGGPLQVEIVRYSQPVTLDSGVDLGVSAPVLKDTTK